MALQSLKIIDKLVEDRINQVKESRIMKEMRDAIIQDIYNCKNSNIFLQDVPNDSRIGTTLRIRLPQDFKIVDRNKIGVDFMTSLREVSREFS